MSRIPLRLRLTAAFALAMALLLAALGAFLYFRLQSSLDEQLNAGLRAHAQAVSTLVARGGDLETGGSLVEADESFSQVLTIGGTVLDASLRSLQSQPLLSQDERERARSDTIFVDRETVPAVDDDDPFRLLGTPSEGGIVIAGASLEDRDEALATLLTQLMIGGPIVLLLSGLAGYALATAALRPVVRRLEAGLARERRFVADASHELRTPLALLETELELALRRPRTAEELRLALESAAEEVERLVRLAEDLLVLARADEGRLPLQHASVSVGDLFETVARRFRPRATEEGRTLDVASGAEESVVADQLRLEQALGNLVDNALRHGSGAVRLDAGRRDGSIELRVSDEGEGFPPSFLPHAFERFARADESRARGATGLGLAIVDAVARAHGGTAEAANRHEGGAVVTLTLPVGGAQPLG
jgi:two-component system, OmpR family, sensor kinase